MGILVRAKWDEFSLEMLITLEACMGGKWVLSLQCEGYRIQKSIMRKTKTAWSDVEKMAACQ